MEKPQRRETLSEKTERLNCYFSLLSEEKDGFWVESKGLSMLPLFYRGVKVHIDTVTQKMEIGDIVVFHRDNKFIAHRIVDYDLETCRYATKGDTLFFFDGPSLQEEFLGRVDRVEKKGKTYRVNTNPAIAELSRRIGEELVHRHSWFPDWLKFLYYFFFFLPGSAWIYLQKRGRNKKGWN